ncbi:MAG: tocopherol cyclase family protein [Haloarculaceae archaeon]
MSRAHADAAHTASTDRDDNRPAFAWPPSSPGSPAREVWYGLVSHPHRPLALWFRYTLLSTTDGHRECRVWGALTDAESGARSCFGTRGRSLEELALSTAPFRFDAGDAGRLTSGGARGTVDTPAGPLSWDLAWEPDAVSFTPLRSRRLTDLASRVLGTGKHWSRNQSIRLSGEVTLDGEPIEFADAPGHQGHTVGRSAPARWRWLHANDFPTDGLAVEALALDGTLSICLRTTEGVHRLNRLHHVVGPWANETVGATPGRWTIRGSGDGVAVEVSVTADADHWQLARYRCPDGSDRFNAHCSRSTVELRYKPQGESTWHEAVTNAGRAEWVDGEPPVEGTYRPTSFAVVAGGD